MIGCLWKNEFEVYGMRIVFGLCWFVSVVNLEGLWMKFNWDVMEDSDYYLFFVKCIFILMYYIGLYD